MTERNAFTWIDRTYLPTAEICAGHPVYVATLTFGGETYEQRIFREHDLWVCSTDLRAHEHCDSDIKKAYCIDVDPKLPDRPPVDRVWEPYNECGISTIDFKLKGAERSCSEGHGKNTVDRWRLHPSHLTDMTL